VLRLAVRKTMSAALRIRVVRRWVRQPAMGRVDPGEVWSSRCPKPDRSVDPMPRWHSIGTDRARSIVAGVRQAADPPGHRTPQATSLAMASGSALQWTGPDLRSPD